MSKTWPLWLVSLLLILSRPASSLEPVPDKLVVLTFDDSVKSHFTVVRPILLRFGFGATFYVTEGFDFHENKKEYMTWDEIAQLNRDGFEIGNHTRDHRGVTRDALDQLPQQLRAIDRRCAEHGIPRPVSFAYPGNGFVGEALPILEDLGIRLARRGGSPEFSYDKDRGRGFAYEPGLDHPLLIPSAGDARPDWELKDFVLAVEQARHGRIAVLQFHGVPDNEHPWVHTPPETFVAYMEYLRDNEYRVIAIRDLLRYIDPEIKPQDYRGVINDRKQALADDTSRDNFRRPQSDEVLRYWLDNMLTHHKFTVPEIGAATGLTSAEIQDALARFDISAEREPASRDTLRVLPYPGGRHPRIGFRDGAIRPQRETKASVFCPWSGGGYVVVDVPEAIWHEHEGKSELLYLAHTHVPTRWTQENVPLPPVEWTRDARGNLNVERTLPNDVTFGARLSPMADHVIMELWITNSSPHRLTGLRVQNCVMLGSATGFARLTNDNKHFAAPYVACRHEAGDRWVITAWQHCSRAWGNVHCPCMHADPTFPDCDPGATHRLRGRLSFYEGGDIDEELRRIEATAWRE